MPILRPTPPEPATISISGKTSSIPSTFLLLIAGALGMAAILALIPAAGHDQLWFLLMAQRWLHGASLYGPQAFDSNTPAVVWLSSLPVLLAEHTPLSIPAAARLCIVLLQAAVAVFSARLLPPLTAAQRLWLLFAFVVLFAVIPARDLGQRDPTAALLFLPYLLSGVPHSSRRHREEWVSRLLAALLAATACCLKPQLTLVAIATEMTLLLRSRKASKTVESTTRPALGRFEPFIFLLAGAAFLLAIRQTAPLFFTLTLPTVLSTYWAIGHLTPLELLKESLELHTLAIITLALCAMRRPTRLTTIFLVAAIASIASYYLQGTGWYYQQLPGLSLFGCALALHLLSFPMPAPSWLPPLTAALVLLALTLTWHFSGYAFTHLPTPDETYAITTPDPTFFTHLPPNTPIATLTTSVDDAIMPVFRYHLQWAQRTNNLWTLPAILRSAAPAGFPVKHPIPQPRLAQLEAQQRQWMIEDLQRWRPALILVARCQDPGVQCQELEDRHDNLLAFYLADPAFASLWAHYRFQRTSGPYDAYTLTAP